MSLSPDYDEAGVRLFRGNVTEVLAGMESGSMNCCVTSPPYWGLRDYGTAEWCGGLPDCDHTYNHGVQGTRGQRSTRTYTAQAVYKHTCGKCGATRIDAQIGLESTPAEYVAKLVEVFREVRRVLRDDGTLFLNLGDSYIAHPGQRKQGLERNDVAGYKQATNAGSLTTGSRTAPGLKPKDLAGIPWRVAFALQEDGWWLRSDIIWAKLAPVPESVTDRPTRSHEHIFLLAKSERYYYDAEAIKEPSVSDHGSGNGYKRELTYADDSGARGSDKPWVPSRPSAKRGSFNGKTEAMADTSRNAFRAMTEFRNKRDVWTVPSDPFPDAHFACFPPALILPCVLAGCPAGGVILDPFSGAGTTALVAKQNGRRAVGIDLNAEYLDMSVRRLSQSVLSFP